MIADAKTIATVQSHQRSLRRGRCRLGYLVFGLPGYWPAAIHSGQHNLGKTTWLYPLCSPMLKFFLAH